VQLIVEESNFWEFEHTATHCNTLQHTATHCNALQRTATQSNFWEFWRFNTLQHTATHGNTLQHAATSNGFGGLKCLNRDRQRLHFQMKKFSQISFLLISQGKFANGLIFEKFLHFEVLAMEICQASDFGSFCIVNLAMSWCFEMKKLLKSRMIARFTLSKTTNQFFFDKSEYLSVFKLFLKSNCWSFKLSI